MDWAKKHRGGEIIKTGRYISKDRMVQSEVRSAFECFGVFFTFNREILARVGYFDSANFGLWKNEHNDYSVRCCLAGFNRVNRLYDAYRSQDYIRMCDEGYVSSISEEEKNRATALYGKDRGTVIFGRKRGNVYVPYNECPIDMNGSTV